MSSALDVSRVFEPNRPPFFFTYWNPFDENSSVTKSWFEYVKDTSLAKYTADCVGQYVEHASDKQVSAIESTGRKISEDQANALDSTARKICGTLYYGFSELGNQLAQMSGQLTGISGQLTEISSAIQSVNHRLDLILDEAKTSNLLQENITELLRIPDSQKQRQRHIEMALKFLKNASKAEELYEDALRELLDAEKIELTDYFVLHRIGMIYLYVPALGNLEKAAEYFVRAGKYAAVESHPEAARLSNILNKAVSKQFSEQAEPSAADISAHAAESYSQAAAAFYALARFSEAAKMAQKAVNCQPDQAKYRFNLAKYLARAGNADTSVQELQKAIEIEPAMAIVAVGDGDLNQSNPILTLLDGLNSSVESNLKKGIKRLKKWPKVNSQTRIEHWIRDAAEGLENGSYPQKLSLVLMLKNCDQMVSQLDEIAAFGIRFDLGKAGDLIWNRNGNHIRNLWLEKRIAHYIIDAQLAEVSRKFESALASSPVFGLGLDDGPEILVATADDSYFVPAGTMRWEANSDTLPAISEDGRVFVGLKDELVALNRKTGKEMWRFKAYAAVGNPIIADYMVYFATKHCAIAVDRRSRQEIWRSKEAGRLELVDAEGRVFLVSESQIYALDGQTGDLLWIFPIPQGMGNLLFAATSDSIFVGGKNQIIAISSKTGKTLWDAKEILSEKTKRTESDEHIQPPMGEQRAIRLFTGHTRYNRFAAPLSLVTDREGEKVYFHFAFCTHHECSSYSENLDGEWEDAEFGDYRHDEEYFHSVACLDAQSGNLLWVVKHGQVKAEKDCRANMVVDDADADTDDNELYSAFENDLICVETGKGEMNNIWDSGVRGMGAVFESDNWPFDILGLAVNGWGTVYMIGRSKKGLCFYSLNSNTGLTDYTCDYWLNYHAILPTCENPENFNPLIIDDEGMIYVKHGGKVFSLYSGSEHACTGAWPMYRQNQQGTSCAVLPHFPEKTVEQVAIEAEARREARQHAVVLEAEARALKAQHEQEIAIANQKRKVAREIARLLAEARAAEAKENSKWFGKNFSHVRYLYAQALALGSKEADDALKRLP